MYATKSNYRVNPRAIGGLIEDVFQNGFQRMFGDEVWGDGLTVPVNINESDSAYELHVMAPGLKKEDFRINVDRNVLHVSYEHKEEAPTATPEDETAPRWLRKEYKLATFRRSFTLNEKINITGIGAKYNDGVLVVTLPKKELQQPLNQEISVD